MRIEKWQLARLKNKCLVAILSLLERYKYEEFVLLRIMRTIPISILKSNLSEVFIMYKKLYGNEYSMEAFGHDELEEDEIDEIGEENFELIIENGFYIYILINSYLQNA